MKKIKLLISSLTFAFLLLVIALLVLNKDVRKTLSALKFVGTVFAQTVPYWTIERDGTSNNLKFYYQTNSPVMQMSGDGKVGIGTVPESKLQVESGMLWLTGLTDNNGNLPGLGFYGGTSGGGIYARGSAGAGNFTLGNASHTFLYGQGSNGNVGIGTAVPGDILHIQKNSASNQNLLRLDNSFSANTALNSIAWYSTDDGAFSRNIASIDAKATSGVNDATRGGNLIFRTMASGGTNTEAMRIDRAGNVGIGTTNPSEKLDVNGNIKGVDINAQIITATRVNAGVCTPCAGASDSRLKKNVKPLRSALDDVLKLQGVTFQWNKADMPTGNHIGFIAQDVEKVLPEVVNTDDKGYKSLEYGNMTAVLVEAMKEQQKKIEQLEKRLQQLEK